MFSSAGACVCVCVCVCVRGGRGYIIIIIGLLKCNGGMPFPVW